MKRAIETLVKAKRLYFEKLYSTLVQAALSLDWWVQFVSASQRRCNLVSKFVNQLISKLLFIQDLINIHKYVFNSFLGIIYDNLETALLIDTFNHNNNFFVVSVDAFSLSMHVT